MKALFLAVVLFSFNALVAKGDAGAPPYLLGPASGAVLKNLFETDTFQLTPGQLGHCGDKKGSTAGEGNIEVQNFDCQLVGASLQITHADGQTKVFPLQNVLIMTGSDFPEIVDYIFSGSWSHAGEAYSIDTPVGLSVRYNGKYPLRLWGDLSIPDYGLSYGIEGRVTKAPIPSLP